MHLKLILQCMKVCALLKEEERNRRKGGRGPPLKPTRVELLIHLKECWLFLPLSDHPLCRLPEGEVTGFSPLQLAQWKRMKKEHRRREFQLVLLSLKELHEYSSLKRTP